MRRRHTDSADSDYRNNRNPFASPMNGHAKWVVAVVSSLLVAALSAMVWADWQSLKATSRKNEMSIAVMQSQFSEIRITLEEIKVAIREKNGD